MCGDSSQAAHFSEERAVAAGSRLESTIAPGTPMPLPAKSSSVMLFWRSEERGMPQKSVSEVCSSTTLAKLSAPSPVMLFRQHYTTQGRGAKTLVGANVVNHSQQHWCKQVGGGVLERSAASNLS